MKKILIFGLIALLLINCEDGDNDLVNDKVTAVNDTFQTKEDTTIELDFLSNDDYTTNSIEITFDEVTKNQGTVEKIGDKIKYTPAKDFVGNDTFNYTICSTITENTCASALITIEVSDGGEPIAVNDAYTTGKNTTLTITDFLDNDTVIDEAELGLFDVTNTKGEVIRNDDGTITYVPEADFSGEDTFTYSLCDDDDTPTCSVATIKITVVERITFNIPSELSNYYNGVVFTNSKQDNFNALQELVARTHTNQLSYGQRHNYLYDADEDLNNTANVVLMYSGESRDEREYTSGSNSYPTQTFNTEHVYPRSKLSSSTYDISESDLHHLRTCDARVNSSRSNYSFIDGRGDYQREGNKWFPGDEWKGDIARMIFYLNARYGETFDQVGTLQLFLKWNKEDPVSDFERQRNTVIYSAQGNRNPFIDNPYLVTITWGGDDADNTWK